MSGLPFWNVFQVVLWILLGLYTTEALSLVYIRTKIKKRHKTNSGWKENALKSIKEWQNVDGRQIFWKLVAPAALMAIKL